MLLLINSLDYKTNLRLFRSSMLTNKTKPCFNNQRCWGGVAKSRVQSLGDSQVLISIFPIKRCVYDLGMNPLR